VECFILFLFIFSFFLYVNFIITIFSSLILPPLVSLLLRCYNSSSSLPTILSAPSYALYSHVFTSPSYLPLTCHHTIPPSYTLNTCWLAYCTFIQPQPSAIPDTSTLHNNNRNIAKHTNGSQNPTAHLPLPPLTHTTSRPPF
jgi:hypothetical protein